MAKETNEREKELIVEYLKANGYSLYSKSHQITWYYWIHKDYDIKDYKKEYSNSGFSLKHSTLRIVGNGEFSEKEIKRTYLKQKWKDELVKDKEYFKEIHYLIKNFENNSLLTFIDTLPTNNNIKLKLIENLPVSTLEAYEVSFKFLKEIVEKSEYNEKEKDSFYLKFFKSRKNQLKGNTGEAATEFLLSLYKESQEKLEAYFPFFPNINNHFNELDLNIEESGYVVFSSRFNMRKAGNLLGGLSETTVQEWTKLFSSSMAKKYGLWSVIEEADKPKAIFEVRFYKSEVNSVVSEDINLDNYKKHLKDFLIYMSQLSEKPKLNFEYITKWLFQKELTKKLESQNPTEQSKEKKLKI